MDGTQDGPPTPDQSLAVCQSSSCCPSQSKAELGEGITLGKHPSHFDRSQLRKSLGEDPPGTGVVATVEATHPQPNPNGPTTPGKIDQGAGVLAMAPCRSPATSRTRRGSARGCEYERQAVSSDTELEQA